MKMEADGALVFPPLPGGRCVGGAFATAPVAPPAGGSTRRSAAALRLKEQMIAGSADLPPLPQGELSDRIAWPHTGWAGDSMAARADAELPPSASPPASNRAAQ